MRHLRLDQYHHIIHRVIPKNLDELAERSIQYWSYEKRRYLSFAQYSAHLRYLQKFHGKFQEKILGMQEYEDLPAPSKIITQLFLKIQFLEGQKREQLFKKYPPKYIYVFRNRMATWNNGQELDPNTNKKWATTMCHAWFVWEKGSITEPIVRWL